jgi:glycosyltransferase involved in cell wall biosynthesis
MKLSVIIPLFNEINTIDAIIDKVNSVPIEKEIIIVDDCSTDGSREFIQNLNTENIIIACHEKNMGKGFAIRTGLKYVTGEIIIIQDADLEYDPNDYPKLIEPIINKKTKVVFGNRYHSGNDMFLSKFKLAVLLLTKMANLLYSININDEATCYKVFHKEVFEHVKLNCKRFEFCPEVIAKVSKAGFGITEIPINYHARSISDGKKIKFKDAIEAFYTLIKYRFIN